MDIIIERKPAFMIAGISVKSTESKDFGKLWQDFMRTAGIEYLLGLGDGQSYGACYNAKSEDDFSYMAGFDIMSEELAKAKGFEVLIIPEAEYAIIPIKGKVPDCIHEGWKYVTGIYLPEHGLKHAGTPDLEVYGDGNMDSEDYQMQLWVPVVKA